MNGYYNKDKAIITTQDNLSTPDTKLSYNNLNLINKQVAAQVNDESDNSSFDVGNNILPYCVNTNTYTPLDADQVQILEFDNNQKEDVIRRESDTAEYHLFNFDQVETYKNVYGDKWVYNSYNNNWYSPIISLTFSALSSLEGTTTTPTAQPYEIVIPNLETQNISINTFQNECYSNINTTYNIFLQDRVSLFLKNDDLVSFYYYQNHCIIIFKPPTKTYTVKFRICIHSQTYSDFSSATNNIKTYVFKINNNQTVKSLYYHYILNSQGIITDIQSLNLNNSYLYTEPTRNFIIKESFALSSNPLPDISFRPTRPMIKPSSSN